MEMLFSIALLSLLWPDGIREHPEAVKQTHQKKKKERRGGLGAMGATRELTGLQGKGVRRKCGESKTQEKKSRFLVPETKDEMCFLFPFKLKSRFT